MLNTTTKEEAHAFLKKNMDRHLSNKVLHAHPSPMHWTTDFDAKQVAQELLDSGSTIDANFYIGIPYCLPTDPPHCGFCLFPTQDYRGKESTRFYLEYVKREAELYRDFYQESNLKSLYVGGGTPNLLMAEDYPLLMEMVHHLFGDWPADTEMTLEGIPQLFNESKVRAIRESGFNRVSMGVQQVNEKLIQASGRKQTRKQVFESIELFHKYGLSCNVDLIFGWPEQSVSQMLHDLQAIVDSSISHITHYELNIAGRSDFARAQRKKVADMQTKREMYRIACEFLRSSGFVQKTVYDWERSSSGASNDEASTGYLYEENLRNFLEPSRKDDTQCMGALGYAAVNMRMHSLEATRKSVSTMNHRKLSEYFKAIDAKSLPVERMYQHSPKDVGLVWIFQSLQEMKISKTLYREIFGSDLLEDFKGIWEALIELDWIEDHEQFLVLAHDGRFHVPLIQTLVAKTRMDEIVKRASTQNGSDVRRASRSLPLLA